MPNLTSAVDRFILVTGTMRSGTTLMGELLYASAYGVPMHPRLSFANDSFDTLRSFLYLLRDKTDISLGIGYPYGTLEAGDANITAAMTEIDGEPFTGLIKSEFTRRILEISPLEQVPLAIGTKSTDIFIEFDVIRKNFGQANMVIMVRDPRDVLASNLVRVGRSLPLDGVTILTCIANLKQFLIERSADPDIQVVRYEDLVNDPVPIMEKVLDLTGLDRKSYNWEALLAGEVASNSSYGSKCGDGFELGSGISSKSIGRFREILNPLQLYAVERLFGDFMSEYGYKRESALLTSYKTEYLNLFLPPLINQSNKQGLSTAGLQKLLIADGLEYCIKDAEQRNTLGQLLLNGDRTNFERFCADLKQSINPPAHPARRRALSVYELLLDRTASRSWQEVEVLANELCGGEQNLERLSRMILCILEQKCKSDVVLDYIDWVISQVRTYWCFLYITKLSILQRNGFAKQTYPVLNDFVKLLDRYLAEHSDDIVYRMIKVESICTYDKQMAQRRLALDIEFLRSALGNAYLPHSQKDRAQAAIEFYETIM